jgi:hypothetical protein
MPDMAEPLQLEYATGPGRGRVWIRAGRGFWVAMLLLAMSVAWVWREPEAWVLTGTTKGNLARAR